MTRGKLSGRGIVWILTFIQTLLLMCFIHVTGLWVAPVIWESPCFPRAHVSQTMCNKCPNYCRIRSVLFMWSANSFWLAWFIMLLKEVHFINHYCVFAFWIWQCVIIPFAINHILTCILFFLLHWNCYILLGWHHCAVFWEAERLCGSLPRTIWKVSKMMGISEVYGNANFQSVMN